LIKKNLISLAMMALAGSALAQSSVTLYGVVDVSYGSATGVSAGMSGGKPGGFQSYHTPTRFGFRGTEDLGDGLSANFNFETGGISMDSGGFGSAGNAGLDFGREAWVGLAGNFGSTRMGRTSSFGTQGHARFDFNGISQSSAMDNVGISPVTWYGSSRRSNQFQYVTPKMSGVDAGLAYVAAGDNGNQASTQARVNYDNGPLSIGFVTESKRNATSRTANALAASYDFGAAKVVGGLVTSPSVAAGKGWYVGAVAPVGLFRVGMHYARNTANDTHATELFGSYALSKRTSLYLDTVSKTGGHSYGVGLLHTF
jgi:predicted porin